MKKFKVAIIGSGFGLSSHLPAFKKNKYCKVIAVCTRNSKKNLLIKKKYNIEYCFNKWEEMLNIVKPDIVSIATPPNEQKKIINSCLKKSISIFAEKPLAINIKDSKKIFLLQKKKKVPCTINFLFPEFPEWIYVKKILRKKTYGNIRNINVDLSYQSYLNYKKKNSWKNNINKGGGIVHNIVCHIFYYLEWFNEPIHSVSSYLYNEKNYKYIGHTNSIIIIKFKSGTFGTIKASNNVLGLNKHIIKFYNDYGTIVIENKSSDWVNGFNVHTINKSLLKKKINFKKIKNKNNLDSRIIPVSKIVNKLVNWNLSKKISNPSFKDGHRIQLLIDATIRSSKLNGKWVKVIRK